MSRDLVCMSVSGQRLLAGEYGQKAGADFKGHLYRVQVLFCK